MELVEARTLGKEEEEEEEKGERERKSKRKSVHSLERLKKFQVL